MSEQLRRRRSASWLCPPLPDGRRDPADPIDDEPVTDRELTSWATAAVHLRRAGLHAVVPSTVRQAWRRRSRPALHREVEAQERAGQALAGGWRP